MRICVVGGGLAGTLLAWRLSEPAAGVHVDLAPGAPHPADATQVSSGAVRAYETDAEQRRLAAASLRELLGSAVLREWSGYQPMGSVYVPAAQADLPDAVAEIGGGLAGWAEIRDAHELAAAGWARLPEDTLAVWEPRAGRISPARLRDAILRDLAHRRSAAILEGPVTEVARSATGTAGCSIRGTTREYDIVVLAAGAWTPRILAAARLDPGGYRVKAIQYTVFQHGGWCPPMFVDEVSDFFGMPDADGLLLGVPTEQWDIQPGPAPLTPALEQRAAALAGSRFPLLRLGPVRRRVAHTDCYTDPPVLALRRAGGPDHHVYVFSGGSGGSAKTVLAASRAAAEELTGRSARCPADHPTGTGRRIY